MCLAPLHLRHLLDLMERTWDFASPFWIVSKWQYPVMYKDAVWVRQMAAWSLVFSKMTMGADHR
jgi:hypothetical protein